MLTGSRYKTMVVFVTCFLFSSLFVSPKSSFAIPNVSGVWWANGSGVTTHDLEIVEEEFDQTFVLYQDGLNLHHSFFYDNARPLDDVVLESTSVNTFSLVEPAHVIIDSIGDKTSETDDVAVTVDSFACSFLDDYNEQTSASTSMTMERYGVFKTDLSWTGERLEAASLLSGEPLTGLSGTEENVKAYALEIVDDASEVRVRTFGGGGDCDLSMVYSRPPFTKHYVNSLSTCEEIRVADPVPGVWYVLLEADRDFQGVTMSVKVKTESSGDENVRMPTNAEIMCWAAKVAAEKAGKKKWELSLSTSPYPSPVTSSPAIGPDGTIYIGVDEHLYAITHAGTPKWEQPFETGGSVDSSPAVGTDGTIYVGSRDDHIYAINPDGTLKWSIQTGGNVLSSPVIGADGTVYVGSMDKRLYALDPNTGDKRWPSEIGDKIVSSPAIGIDGTIYVEAFGDLYAIDPRTGQERWPSFRTYDFSEQWQSSPAIGADGTVYVEAYDKLYALNPETGKEYWVFSDPVEYDGDRVVETRRIDSAPVVGSDGTIYIGAEDSIIALWPDGRLRWFFPVDAGLASSPALAADGTVHVFFENGRLYAVEPPLAERDYADEKWNISIGGQTWSSELTLSTPVIGSDGTIYIGGPGGELTAIYSDSGGLADSPWPMFRHDLRHTGMVTSRSPAIMGPRHTGNSKPSWTWKSSGGTGYYRVFLDGAEVMGFDPFAETFTPIMPLADGGHVLSVQELIDGQWSNPSSFAIHVDSIAPNTTIETVTGQGPGGGVQNSLKLSCNDAFGSGCAVTLYSTDSGLTWDPYMEPIPIRDNTKLNYYSVDLAGNWEAVQQVEGDAFTTISLELSSQTILQTGTLDVAGKLSRRPDTGQDLSELAIQLTITPPVGAPRSTSTMTTTRFGHFEFLNLTGFTEKGPYSFHVDFEGTALLAPARSVAQTVLVGASAGYAILVQGKISNEEGLDSHNLTANRIYKALLDRGFLEANIFYFNYNLAQTGVTGIPSKEDIRAKIETWAFERMKGVPAPLFLIMVDHGSPSAFYVGDEVITPTDLRTWLDSLEAQLAAFDIQEEQIVVIGACYSGSFIEALSAPGRTIITSAAGDEESFKGPLEDVDGKVIRVGEFFLEEFFHELKRGHSIHKSFVRATNETEIYTRRGATGNNALNMYLDDAMQHPLLDDNGDGAGSNLLAVNGDGQHAAKLHLGVGATYQTNAPGNPAEITSTAKAVHLAEDEDSVSLWAQVNDSSRVASAWLEVRPPSHTLSQKGGTIQLENDLAKHFLTLTSSNVWETNLKRLFTEPGLYEIFYFVRDSETGDLSPMRRSVVYKNRLINHPPEPFKLLSPENGSEISTIGIFNWEDTADVDGDQVTYNLLIAENEDFTPIVHLQDSLVSSVTVVDNTADLKDLTRYYWRVEAVDGFGAVTVSPPMDEPAWFFKTNNTNIAFGIIQGLIVSDRNLARITGAQMNCSLGARSESILFTEADGQYLIITNAEGEAIISSKKPGYQTAVSNNIVVELGKTYEVNFKLKPDPNSIPKTKAMPWIPLLLLDD